MMKLINCLTLIAVAIMYVPQAADAKKPAYTDHPILSAYDGSKIYSKDVKQYDEYRIFKGWDKENKEYNTETLEGKVTKILYSNPKERSVLEVYRNYEKALKTDGVEVLYSCNQAKKECMDAYVGAYLRREFNLSSIGNASGRYMVAKLEQEDQTAYVILGVGEKYTDVHVIEMKKMEEDKVAVNLSALTEDLDKQGFVVVEGIYFDTDKTVLKPNSKPALEQVATLLKERPDVSLYVVGHTDMQGSIAHNKQLSSGRAKAVVTALVSDYNIDSKRLKGHGVGPLAPVASNATEAGRAKNRRVVLVQR